MREVILDTETTGLDPSQGHRIVEIGCVELFNHVPTGLTYQAYINPERDMPTEAAMIHGLSGEFLASKPPFAGIVEAFLEFIGEAPLVIHNAAFDMGFLNAELTRHGFPALPSDRAIDTVKMARRMFPGAPASLDALCKRFSIDASGRQLHGALLDARLLADIYLELCGGRQPDLAMAAATTNETEVIGVQKREYREPRPHVLSEDELKAHETFLEQIKNPLWTARSDH